MREKIRLDSSAGTGHFYTTTKIKEQRLIRLRLRNLILQSRKHVFIKKIKLNNNFLSLSGL